MFILTKGRLQDEFSALAAEWQKRAESALKAAAEEANRRVARNSEQIEKQAATQFSALGKAFADTTAEAEAKVGALRETLSRQEEKSKETLEQLQGAEHWLGEQLIKLEVVAQAARQDLEDRVKALLQDAGDEMVRRAEGMVSSWTERFQSFQQTVGLEIDRLSKLNVEISSRVETAGEMLRQIENAGAAAKYALAGAQESLEKSSERAVGSTAERLQLLIEEVKNRIEESGRSAAQRTVAEFENKALAITHETFGTLLKASESQEKKLQTEAQTLLQREVQVALEALKERAESGLHEFRVKTEAAARLTTADLENQTERIRAQMETAGQESSTQFRAKLNQEVQGALTTANQELFSQVRLVQETMKALGESLEKKLNDALTQLEEQAIESHKARLENVSNAWLLNAAARLGQDSEEHLKSLARLHQSCSSVFADLGENLRRKLSELTGPSEPPSGENPRGTASGSAS